MNQTGSDAKRHFQNVFFNLRIHKSPFSRDSFTFSSKKVSVKASENGLIILWRYCFRISWHFIGFFMMEIDTFFLYEKFQTKEWWTLELHCLFVADLFSFKYLSGISSYHLCSFRNGNICLFNKTHFPWNHCNWQDDDSKSISFNQFHLKASTVRFGFFSRFSNHCDYI